MKRRDVLAALAGTAGLAGCLGGSGGSTPTATVTPTETPPPIADRSFSVLRRECGAGENVASVAVSGSTVTVEGTIGGRDTCDTAVLRSLTLEDGTLAATVAVEPEPTTETPVCAQCLTDIEYRLTVELDRSALERIVVTHHSGGETLTVVDEPVP